jgi:hypothetical protein
MDNFETRYKLKINDHKQPDGGKSGSVEMEYFDLGSLQRGRHSREGWASKSLYWRKEDIRTSPYKCCRTSFVNSPLGIC